MNPNPMRDQPVMYEIRVRGVLDPDWSDRLGGSTVVAQPEGETLLTGPIRDQAALHGVIAKIRDLGLPLLAVNRIENGASSGVGDGEVFHGL
jgi:hypothetical protein